MNFYNFNDFLNLQNMNIDYSPINHLLSIDKLVEKDNKREEDGFPRKLSFKQLIKPSKTNKIVVVPTIVEEKLIHDNSFDSNDDIDGSADGEEGDVIGESPINREGDSSGGAGGEGNGENHEIESNAYELGKILTERFKLPNLQDKGKTRALTKYIYDLTDKNQGSGQLLDKKATLKSVIKTNIALDQIKKDKQIDPQDLIVSPKDKIYRILSREKDYESQAMVFFIRDYSGSMTKNITDIVVSLHVLLYSWIIYAYQNRVETRFILHDTGAKEVPDFNTYYNSKVAGGTLVHSAYKYVNEIVEKENLASNYNIYVFHGTDGDDWDQTGNNTIPELEKILSYVSRMGLTIIRGSNTFSDLSTMQLYLKNSFLQKYKKEFRMDVLNNNPEESRLIESMKKLLDK